MSECNDKSFQMLRARNPVLWRCGPSFRHVKRNRRLATMASPDPGSSSSPTRRYLLYGITAVASGGVLYSFYRWYRIKGTSITIQPLHAPSSRVSRFARRFRGAIVAALSKIMRLISQWRALTHDRLVFASQVCSGQQGGSTAVGFDRWSPSKKGSNR